MYAATKEGGSRLQLRSPAWTARRVSCASTSSQSTPTWNKYTRMLCAHCSKKKKKKALSLLLWFGATTRPHHEIYECSPICTARDTRVQAVDHFSSVLHLSLHHVSVICCDNKCITERSRFSPSFLRSLESTLRNSQSSLASSGIEVTSAVSSCWVELL